MPRTSLSIDQILNMLSASPQRIAALAADLTPAQLRTRPAPGEWSATDVLAHLRSCADVWGGCITTILNEDTPTIRAMDPRTWTKQTNYPDLEFLPSLHAFTSQRTDLLALLAPLPPDAWTRSATVTGAGKPLTYTVHTYATRLAIHERPHLKQIARVVAALRT